MVPTLYLCLSLSKRQGVEEYHQGTLRWLNCRDSLMVGQQWFSAGISFIRNARAGRTVHYCNAGTE